MVVVMVDVHRLKVFRAVVASGSVHAAAENLGYAPSTVSQHLSALQRETKLVLLEKTGRGIAPTPAGQHLADVGGPVMVELARLEDEIAVLQTGERTAVTIGTFASAAQRLLPPVIRTLVDEFEDLTVSVVFTDQGVTPVTRCDLQLVSGPTEESAPAAPGMQPHLLGHEGYQVIVPADHPFADVDEVPMNSIATERLVNSCAPSDACSLIINQACAAAGFSPNYVATTADNASALAFVEAGLGITIMPYLVASELQDGLVGKRLIAPAPRRYLFAHLHQTLAVTRVGERLMGLLAYEARRRLRGLN